MGGCIGVITGKSAGTAVSSLYGRVYRKNNWEAMFSQSFLPVWEGVSYLYAGIFSLSQFPPCMGGCISLNPMFRLVSNVSSLYGRVYRKEKLIHQSYDGFLPVWEGVSTVTTLSRTFYRFPPCMGGCIGRRIRNCVLGIVSSLYGRVYRSYP